VSDTARPLLPASVPLLRGDADALQIGGVDTRDGLLVSPHPHGLAALLRGLDGRRVQRAVLADAAREGLDTDAVTAVLDGLRATHLLVDVDAADLLATDAGPAAAARRAAESPPAEGWRARRGAVVVVDGATRVGTPLAAVLAASGVGRVSVRDAGLVAAGDAVRRASPLTDLRPVTDGALPDLVVLARPWAASDPTVAGWQRAGVPHLVATVRGSTGVVGPLVVPGVTSCLRCADLHRRDADPRWPRLAAQLTAAEPPPSGATVTCLLTAVTAAVQVLAYLDGSAAPITLDATLELSPPDLVPRVRRWTPHPECGCAQREQRATGDNGP
jgi:hypothetical protein